MLLKITVRSVFHKTRIHLKNKIHIYTHLSCW